MPAKPRRHKRAQKMPKRSVWPGLLLSVLILGGGAGAGWHYLTQPGQLPLKVVEVNGEFTHLSRDEIGRRVAGVVHGGFFDVDMQAVRDAVQGMPWVEQVSVRRVWPDTLRMHVTEQVPLAHWGKTGLVNIRGDVFRPTPIPVLQALPTLQGGEAKAPEMVRFYLELYRAVLGLDVQVSKLALNARGEWRVRFANDLSVMLGKQQVGQRLKDFLRVYPQLAADAQRRPVRIDMRYEHGFAVRWESRGDAALTSGAALNADGDS